MLKIIIVHSSFFFNNFCSLKVANLDIPCVDSSPVIYVYTRSVTKRKRVIHPNDCHCGEANCCCCIVVLLFYVHGKHLRSFRDGQLT